MEDGLIESKYREWCEEYKNASGNDLHDPVRTAFVAALKLMSECTLDEFHKIKHELEETK